jgi:hypothetical protein
VHGVAALGEHLVHRALEDRDQQVVLALEIEVNGARRHAGDARHVSHLRLEIAVLREHLGGRAQDEIALVGAGGRLADDGQFASGSAGHGATE